MAWPDVQPPAQRAPNPTRKPPPITMSAPTGVASAAHETSCAGTKPARSVTPRSASAATVEGESASGADGSERTWIPISPPTAIPAAKARFQVPAERQSY